MHRRSFLAVAPLAATPILAAGRPARAAPAALDGQADPWTDIAPRRVTDLGATASRNIRVAGQGGEEIDSFGDAPSGVTKTIRSARLVIVNCGAPSAAPSAPVRIIGNLAAAAASAETGYGGRLVVEPGDVVVVASLGGGVWEVLEFHANASEAYWMPWTRGEPRAPSSRIKTWGAIGPGDDPTFTFAIDLGIGKATTGGLFLRDWGDTGEIGFDIGSKNAKGRPAPFAAAPAPGGYIYSRAGIPDGEDLRFVDPEAYVRAGAGPTYLYIGRPCQLEFPITEAPTQQGTGGGFTVCVTRNGTVTPIQRSWWSNTGNFVAAGKATFEAGKVPYPYNVTALPWWDPKATHQNVQRWNAPSGDCNYFETPGWGNLTVIMTDIASAALDHNAAIAMRRFGDHGAGVDFGHDFTDDRWAVYRVHEHVRTRSLSIAPRTGDITLGDGPANTHAIHGAVTTPHNPAFEASLGRDVAAATGDGTAATIVFDAEAFDRAGNFDPRTGAFTAPVAGLYQLQAAVQFGGFGRRDALEIAIVTPGRTHRLAPGVPAADSQGRAGAWLSVVAALKAGEAATVSVSVGGGARTVSLLAGQTSFSGFLIG